MDLSESMNQLSETFKNRDWFYDIGMDQYGRVVVYVKYMCHETLHDIPDKCGGKQVLVHFAASKLATRESFTNPKEENIPVPLVKEKEIVDVTEFAEEDLDDLRDELDRLERICGTNILSDIFFEVHDKKNAVTNLSAKYPDVAAKLSTLYNEYGFDVIYEELEI